MKIDGIDPLLLNRIKEKTDRFEVQRAEEAVTDNRVKKRHASSGQEEPNVPDRHYSGRLDRALQRLNDTADSRNLALRFKLQKESNPWVVDIVDLERNQVVRQIPTDRALEVVNRIQNLVGVSLDVSR